MTVTSPLGNKALKCHFLTRILSSLFRRNDLKIAIKRHELKFCLFLAPTFHVRLCAPNFFHVLIPLIIRHLIKKVSQLYFPWIMAEVKYLTVRCQDVSWGKKVSICCELPLFLMEQKQEWYSCTRIGMCSLLGSKKVRSYNCSMLPFLLQINLTW